MSIQKKQLYHIYRPNTGLNQKQETLKEIQKSYEKVSEKIVEQEEGKRLCYLVEENPHKGGRGYRIFSQPGVQPKSKPSLTP